MDPVTKARDIGRRVGRAQERAAMSNAELARRVKRTRSWVSQLRGGRIKSVKGETLIALAAALSAATRFEVSAEWLETGRGPEPWEKPANGGQVRENGGRYGASPDSELLAGCIGALEERGNYRALAPSDKARAVVALYELSSASGEPPGHLLARGID